MRLRVRLIPFVRPRDRAARLPYLVLVGLAVGVLALWNPVTAPGPVLCTSRLAFGVPCPLCGGTRGAALCLRGHLAAGLAYNPLSLPALLVAFSLIARWSFEYLSNRRIVIEQPPWLRRASRLVVVLAFVATWVYLLAYRNEDSFATSWLGSLLAWRAG